MFVMEFAVGDTPQRRQVPPEAAGIAQQRLHQNYTATNSVAANVRYSPGEKVARDGIEPPTQGFSVLCSTN